MSDPVLFVSIGTPDPDQPEALQDYAAKAPPILIEAGAVPKVKARLAEPLIGSQPPGTLFVAEFPSAAAARAVFETDAYKALIPAREKAFKHLNFLIMEAF
jgi:uncharacterized protein (DUF1330 family)